jgi:hypothetical protein
MSNLPERTYPADQVDVRPAYDGFVPYPTNEAYRWQSFAMLAIESDGYGDLSAIDPYTGRRLTAPVGTREGYGTGSIGRSVYDQMRMLIDEMERSQFLASGRAKMAQAVADAITPGDTK